MPDPGPGAMSSSEAFALVMRDERNKARRELAECEERLAEAERERDEARAWLKTQGELVQGYVFGERLARRVERWARTGR